MSISKCHCTCISIYRNDFCNIDTVNPSYLLTLAPISHKACFCITAILAYNCLLRYICLTTILHSYIANSKQITAEHMDLSNCSWTFCCTGCYKKIQLNAQTLLHGFHVWQVQESICIVSKQLYHSTAVIRK